MANPNNLTRPALLNNNTGPEVNQTLNMQGQIQEIVERILNQKLNSDTASLLDQAVHINNVNMSELERISDKVVFKGIFWPSRRI